MAGQAINLSILRLVGDMGWRGIKFFHLSSGEVLLTDMWGFFPLLLLSDQLRQRKDGAYFHRGHFCGCVWTSRGRLPSSTNHQCQAALWFLLSIRLSKSPPPECVWPVRSPKEAASKADGLFCSTHSFVFIFLFGLTLEWSQSFLFFPPHISRNSSYFWEEDSRTALKLVQALWVYPVYSFRFDRSYFIKKKNVLLV